MTHFGSRINDPLPLLPSFLPPVRYILKRTGRVSPVIKNPIHRTTNLKVDISRVQ